ncbi:ribonuclease III [Mycoplasma miroungirhinis]|uniref:Ribonuclease 3 n=1 Tax=Mycoplasma miroungirhinis TaxID=754516 RepID=A0A6M4JH62_9MOLU|nr:ribonuclease III [Mycoplasma miroungirhinis]QJR44362.1 ribonuclease III [Mycoplasma miroungirhinis]
MNNDFNQKLLDILHKFNINTNNLTNFHFFEISFTHSTFANEHRQYKSYELNEYLGDAILQFKVSEYLFLKYNNIDEGHATTLRSTLVKTENLAKISQKYDLFSLLKASMGAINQLQNSKKVYADLFESFIAAIYLSLGMKAVEQVLNKTIFADVEYYVNKENKDAKTLFQEFIQSNDLSVSYETKKHQDGFISTVIYNKTKYGVGLGKNKKEAEENAAQNALKNLNI